MSAADVGKPYIPTYKVKYPVPEPTDDENSGDEMKDEAKEDEVKGDEGKEEEGKQVS